MRTCLIFTLLGLVPLGIAAFLLLQSGISPDPINAGLGATALISVLTGFALLLGQGRHVRRLAQSVGLIAAGKRKEAEAPAKGAASELHQIDQHVRTLAAELDKGKRNFAELVNRFKQHAAKTNALIEKLKRESVLRDYLARYVGNDVIEQIILSQDADPLKNERCEATLLFADIRSFTTLSENMSPEEVISMLNEYFDAMVEIIFKHGGVLDKFVGDELMAVFSQQTDKTLGPLAAVRTAVDMQNRISELMQERNARGQPVFQVGVGVNTGNVVTGNVGAKNRMDYTVIGDTVNVAARLEQMAEGGEVIVGEQTYAYCKHGVVMSEKGSIRVKNRDEAVKCYEVEIKSAKFN